MLPDFDIEDWLSIHSVSIERSKEEVIFRHVGDEFSVLLLRQNMEGHWNVPCLPLVGFYGKYSGGYIGTGGYLLIGCPGSSDKMTSTGIQIPSLSKIKKISEKGGLLFESDETPFISVGYMFVYSFFNDGRFCMHDRDFKKNKMGAHGERAF